MGAKRPFCHLSLKQHFNKFEKKFDTKKSLFQDVYLEKMCYKFCFAVNRKFDQSVKLVEMK